MSELPETSYAKAGDIHIAYQVVGGGPIDLAYLADAFTHVELQWEHPDTARFLNRLASFSRLIMLDKRGIGLSDAVPITELALEGWMEDLLAVLDAVGSERPVVFGSGSGAASAMFFAASFPERVSSLVVANGYARARPAPDYLPDDEDFFGPGPVFERFLGAWGDVGAVTDILRVASPSLADDDRMCSWLARLWRTAAPPATALAWASVMGQLDVRDVLPAISAPTLVLHRSGDGFRRVEHGRYIGEHIRGAKFVELPGDVHYAFLGDNDDMVDEIEEFLTGTRHGHDVDRVLATVMFTDIVGSTERLAEVGDSRWRHLLDAHDAVVRREIDRFRGREINTMGDGFFATFDGPARAVRCAHAVTAAVAPLAIEVRAGLHTGECEVRGDDLGGLAVHIAARIGALARAGEVLVSSTVKDLVVGSGISFADRGSHKLKGVPDRWRVFAVQAS